MSNLKYRPDIDGLRALAVLIIIVFHFDKTVLTGGFMGVDIFFVISGFIITSLIYPQIQSNEFSFSEFYNKRIKRILPLYYLVAVTSLIIAYLLFSPNDFVSFADSLRYSSAFISNIYFERNTGYFANSSETMPLLNIWSLSVEEQFYLIWPIFLLAATRFVSNKVAVGIIVALIIALASYSHFLAITSSAEAYFLIQSRGFELLMGAILAIGLIKKRQKELEYNPRIYQLSGIVGVAIILVMLISLDKESLFPSYNAVLVCIGAMLIIFSGSNKNTPLYKFLSLPLLVYIGRLSYSLYLWHWPIQSFYRYYYSEFGLKGFAICSVLTLIFSVASFKLIENPLRYTKFKKRYIYLFYFVLPLTTLILIAKNIEKNEGYPDRFSDQALQLYLSSISKFEGKDHKLALMEGFSPFSPTVIGNQYGNKPTAYIWGDSHAQHFRGFVDELGKKYGFSALFSGEGGCPPIAEGGIIKNGALDKKCEQNNKSTLESILRSDVEIVFLGGRWAVYTETTLAENEEGNHSYLGDKHDQIQSVENNRRVITKGLEKTISTLIAHGKTPIIFTQIPSYPFNPSNCLFKKMTVESLANLSCDIDKQAFEERYRFAKALFASFKDKYPQMLIIDTQPLVCRDNTCVSQLDEQPLYKDNDHINSLGARKLYHEYMKTGAADELKQKFEQVYPKQLALQ